MGITDDIKEGVYFGTSIVRIALLISEITSVIIAVIISLSIAYSPNVEQASRLFVGAIYFIIIWLLEQILIAPLVWFIDKANKWSRE